MRIKLNFVCVLNFTPPSKLIDAVLVGSYLTFSVYFQKVDSGIGKQEFILILPHGANETLIHVRKIQCRETGQEYLKEQNCWIVLHCREVAVLKYVRENQELQKYGSAYAA
jgi:hypothetical protein